MSYRSTSMFAIPLLVAGVLAAQERPQERERPAPPPTRAPQTAPPAPVRPAPERPAAERPAPERPAASPSGARSVEERRAVAQDAARFEANYRSAVARIDRLISVYQSKGNQEKVLQLERMRDQLAVRREHAMEGFRRDLGDEGFHRVQGQLQGGGRRAVEERAKKARPPGEDAGGR
jgi:hypothetical protein